MDQLFFLFFTELIFDIHKDRNGTSNNLYSVLAPLTLTRSEHRRHGYNISSTRLRLGLPINIFASYHILYLTSTVTLEKWFKFLKGFVDDWFFDKGMFKDISLHLHK